MDEKVRLLWFTLLLWLVCFLTLWFLCYEKSTPLQEERKEEEDTDGGEVSGTGGGTQVLE